MPKIENITSVASDNPATNKSEVSQSNSSALNSTVYQSDPTQLKSTSRQEHFPYTGQPSAIITLSSTGTISGPLASGDYFIFSEVACYFRQGSSSLTLASITIDRTTPSTSNPLTADMYFPIKITGSTDNYIGVKTASGYPTGLFYIIRKV